MTRPLVSPRGLLAYALGAVSLAFIAVAAAAPLVVEDNAAIPEGTQVSYDSITVADGATLTIGGGSEVTVAGAVTVQGSGQIVFAGRNVDGQVDGVWAGEGSWLRAGSMSVAAGGAIHADGQGYTARSGPGGSVSNIVGASYGGSGRGSGVAGVYGSMREPVALGSSTGRADSGLVNGGGALRLTVAGELALAGRISANGLVTSQNHSGATGGSVWIEAGTLSGTGAIQANASEGGPVGGNQTSGGGRVAVYYADASGFGDLGVIVAEGAGQAQDGTVYLEDTSSAEGSLRVFGRTRFGEDSVEQYTEVVIEDGGQLEIDGGSELTVGNLSIKSGGVLQAEGKANAAQVDGSWAGEGVRINATTVTVEAGGALSADGQGYTTRGGPGGASSNIVGASHGGAGLGSTAAGAYGSMREPEALGSATGIADGRGVFGGGAIRLTVSQSLAVDGRISANGVASSTNHSGATGGSLWITAPSLSGVGTISADASVGGEVGGNLNSGGGRVAVYFSDASGFEDLSAITASGAGAAQDGTVYLLDVDSAEGDLRVFGRARLEEGDADLSYSAVTVESGGSLELAGGVMLSVSGELRVANGGEVLAEGKSNDGREEGLWLGEGVRIAAGSVVVDEGGVLHADGQGYRNGLGPGGSGSNTVGASHGGRGEGNAPATVGSMREPLTLGSATAVFGATTAGGGAIRIDVEDTFTVNGRVSANGVATGDNHSGATGGSLWIEAGSLAGSGVVQANASSGGLVGGNRNSAGGRIAVYYSSVDGFEDIGRIQALGSGSAERGTVYLEDVDAAFGAITVTGRFRLDAGAFEEFSALTVRSGGDLELGGGSRLKVGALVVESGGVVVAESRIEGGEGEGVEIEAETLTVEQGATISADGQGFPSVQGPGTSGSNVLGASFGGRGTGASAGPVYGDPFAPVELGSSSGVAFSSIAGGGAIRIDVSDTFTLNGTVTANGMQLSGDNHSGATGGSIWVTTGVLTGSGSFHADASVGGLVGGNGESGGGRIAVYYTDASGFADMAATSADGGEGAEEGTALFVDASGERAGATVVERLDLGAGSVERFRFLRLVDAARLDLGGGSALVADEELALSEGSLLDARSVDNAGRVDGMWKGRGSTVVAAELTVSADSAISADGRGYANGAGPGASPASNVIGASHGGKGSGASGPVYGEASAPLELGSASGVFGSSTFGGGAIRLLVAGTATVDGEVTANGLATGTNHSGATGGSVWLMANELVGSGEIKADASAGGATGGNGNSGGGRVALSVVEPIERFDLEKVTAAAGGAGAEAGTVSFETSSSLVWLSRPAGLLIGDAAIGWVALGIEAGDEVRFSATGSTGRMTLRVSEDVFESFAFDTTTLRDGEYDFRIELVSAQGEVKQSSSATGYIDNSLQWRGGTLSSDTTWRRGAANIVAEDVVIPEGVTLTIEPGAVVKFARGTKIDLLAGATLRTGAGATLPVVMTSLYDDAILGDTNRDGDATQPRNGDWTIRTAVLAEFAMNRNTVYRFGNQSVNGRISGTVRFVEDSVYVLEDGLEVEPNSTLIVDPGVVLKIGYKQSMVFKTGSSLQMRGTLAKPVVVTSIRDDERGGDSNGDGTDTAPAPGDWLSLYFNGASADIQHAHVLYGAGSRSGGWSASAAIRTSGASMVTVRDSWLARGFYDGVLAWGGPVTLENTVVEGFDRGVSAHPGSVLTVTHGTFVDNRINLLMHGGSLRLYNSIVADAVEFGLLRDFGGHDIVARNNLFWNSATQGAEVAGLNQAVIGESGNVVADPLLVGPRPGIYELRASSPAIDAAAGDVGTELDARGYPRLDDPNYDNAGTALGSGGLGDLGAFEFLGNWESPYDLVVASVDGPAQAEVGELVDVSWTLRNDGSFAVEGPWYDTISLARPTAELGAGATAGSFLIGEGVTLEPGETLEVTRSVRVPGVGTGTRYWQTRTNARGTVLEGGKTANNVTRSSAGTRVSLAQLMAGASAFSSTFEGDGDSFWFVVDTSQGQLSIDVETAGDGAAVTEVYVGYGRLPTPQDYDGRQIQWGTDDVNALAPRRGTPIYVLVTAKRVYQPGVAVNVSVSERSFAVTETFPEAIGDSGTATMEVRGAALGEGLAFELVAESDAQAYPASAVYSVESTVAYVTFPMDGVPQGTYRVRARAGAVEASSGTTVTVEDTVDPYLEVEFFADPVVRAGRDGDVRFSYRNGGNVDLTAPMMRLLGTVEFRPPPIVERVVARSTASQILFPHIPEGQVAYVEHLLGTSETGPAGILRPGADGGRYDNTFLAPGLTNGLDLQLDWQTPAGSGEPFDWEAFAPALRPIAATDAGWDWVLGSMKGIVGDTVGEVGATLAETATHLSRVGTRERSVGALLAMQLRQADPSGSLATMGEERAVGRVLPDLTANRIRFREAASGDTFAIVDFFGSRALYQETTSASVFKPSVDDGSRLLSVDGGYALETADGGRLRFGSNGLLTEIYDGFSTRVQTLYDGSRLTAFLAGEETLMSFEYDENGYVKKQVFRDGAEMLYAHDEDGHLLSMTTPFGLVANYSYVDAGLPEKLLSGITVTGGDARSLSYDAYGRVTSQTDLGVETQIQYLEAGRIRFSDSTGWVEVFTNENGDARLTRADDGREVRQSYDEETGEQLTWSSDGRGYVSIFDDDGLLSETVDTSGVSRLYSVDKAHEYVNRYLDHRGQETAVSLIEQGYPQSVAYPDSTSSISTFDGFGRRASWTNRAGQTISYAYLDDRELLSAKTFPDGAEETFGYDAKGALVSATNANGTTEFERDGQGRITKVTYPHGHWLSYTYDGEGRRATMTDDSGYEWRYGYDETGRLSEVRDGSEALWVEYHYDDRNRLARQTHANGVTTVYRYDSLTGQLQSVEHVNSADELVNKSSYEVDGFGVRHRKETVDGVVEFEYDGLDRLVSQDGVEGSYRFAYDDAGNRTMSAANGVATSYQSNALDQYTEAGAFQYAYDADGNLVLAESDAETWTYAYDAAGRLVGYEGPGMEVEYRYDAMGHRVSQVVNGQATHFVLDPVGDLETVAMVGSGGRRNFVFSHFGLAGQSYQGSRFHYHTDGNFNVTEITDADETVVNRYRYSPYGRVEEAEEVVENPFTFVGGLGMEEAPNGQYWAFVRQYDPDLGRFLRIDPNRRFGASGYEYASNQPTNRFDYNGFDGGSVMDTVNSTSSTLGVANNVYDAKLYMDNFEINLNNDVDDHTWRQRVAKDREKYEKAFDEYQSQRDDASGKSRKNSKHRRALDQKRQKFSDAHEQLTKTETDYSNLKKSRTTPKKSIVPKGATDALGKGGTALSIYNAGNSLNDYRNGKPGSGLAATHDVAVAIADGIQYIPVPGAKPVSAALTTADTVSQWTFNGLFWSYYSYTSRESSILGPRSLDNLKNGRERRRTRIIGSFDPNDKATVGVGEMGYILNGTTITYRIRFENLKTASAAAQQVIVLDFLDERLDWSTFEIVEFGFNQVTVRPPSRAQSFRGVVEVASDPYPVDVSITLDPDSGELLMDMRSFDPTTQDFPDDPFAGFLPPNDEESRGEGYLLFRIKPDTGLADGERFTNQARIFFDVNEPIDTNVVTNTIDTTAPSSQVLPFGSNPGASFEVRLAGDDDGGSGVASYDLYVSENDGPFAYWSTVGSEMTVFNGVPETKYGFYSVATDAVGLREAGKTAAEAEVVAGFDETPFRVWSIEHFGLEAFTDPLQQESLWGDLADPDGDGLVNRLERYAGLDPLTSDVASIFDYDYANGVLEVSFRRAAAATDLAGGLMTSSDLVVWSESDAAEAVEAEGAGVERVRVPFTLDEANLFIALMIEFAEGEEQSQ